LTVLRSNAISGPKDPIGSDIEALIKKSQQLETINDEQLRRKYRKR